MKGEKSQNTISHENEPGYLLGRARDSDKGDTDLSSLRFVICGAAPLSVELFNRFETQTGVKTLEGYLEDTHNKGIWPKKGWLNWRP